MHMKPPLNYVAFMNNDNNNKSNCEVTEVCVFYSKNHLLGNVVACVGT